MYNRNNMTINRKKKKETTTLAVEVVEGAMGYWKAFDHEEFVQT